MNLRFGSELDSVSWKPARTGQLTAVSGDRHLSSAYDPEREAKRLAEAVGGGRVTVAGLGLGHVAAALGPRLDRILALPGEIERLRLAEIPGRGELLNRVHPCETLRKLRLELFHDVTRGNAVLIDPVLEAAPDLVATIRNLLAQATGTPRACFLHLKTAGDIIRTFASLQEWKRHQAAAQVILLVEEPYGELASLAEGIDRVVEIARDGARLPAEIRRQLKGPLLGVNFAFESRPARFLAELDPLFAVGYRQDEGEAHPALVDDRSPARVPDLEQVRNRMNRWHFAQTLLGLDPSREPPALRVPAASHPGARIVQFGAGSGAAVWAAKRASPEAIGEALRQLGGRWLAVGGADEREVAARAGIADEDNLCGRTSWTDLAALLAGASLYIGHDSGPTHLAAALGIPTLALFGFTSPILNAPIGPRTLLVQADMPCAFGGCAVPCPEVACTAALTPDAIVAAVRHLDALVEDDSRALLRTADKLRRHGLRPVHPGRPVEDANSLRTLLDAEPRLGPPRDPALALAREWLETTAR